MRPAPLHRLIMLAALVCSCGDDNSGVHDAIGDPGDSPTGQAIACGATSCTTPQACCDLPSPSTDFCYAATSICEGGRAIRCDGNEDCPSNELCCYSGGSSYCAAAATCTANSGQVMCHGTCETGQCCPTIGDSPYSICKPSC